MTKKPLGIDEAAPFATALDGSVSRARGTLLAANLIALVITASIFNAVCSWNYQQIARRGILLSYANEVETAMKDPKVSFDEALRTAEAKFPEAPWIRQLFSHSNGIDLSYLRATGAPRALQDVCQEELHNLLARQERMDTIHLPFLGMDFASTDRTIIGGLALMIVAFWLIGNLSRQQGALALFVTSPTTSGERPRLTDVFTPDASQFAYYLVSQSPAFSSPSRLVSTIQRILFLFPPASIGLSMLYVITVGAFFNLLTVSRSMLEVLACLGMAYLWYRAWLSNRLTEQMLDNWKVALQT